MSPWVVVAGLAGAILLWPKKAAAAATGGGVSASAQERREFAERILAALSRVAPALPVAAKALVIAHGAYETGWGKVGSAPTGHNYWNVTVGSRQYKAPSSQWVKGAGIPGKDKDGQGRPIEQTWRSYASDDAALSDFLSTFVGPAPHALYPEAYQSLMRFSGDVTEYATNLRKRGYFEAPLADYTKTLQAVYKTVVLALGGKV